MEVQVLSRARLYIMKKLFILLSLLLLISTPFVGVFAATTKKTTPKSSTTKKITTKKPSVKKTTTQPIPQRTGKKLGIVAYYVPGSNSFASLQMYGSQVKVLAPQVYTVDASGRLTGSLSEKAIEEINKHKLSVMPLVSNKDFKRDIMPAVFADEKIQDKIIDALVTEAKKNNYIGWQFDFEAMHASDRDNYSAFVEKAAKVFKSEKLFLSVAVIPRFSELPEDLPTGSWEYWAGVYDFARIGKAVDFVSLMTYDDPYSIGPVAQINWFKKSIAYAKKFIPVEKLSVGIPTYGWVWDMENYKRIKSMPYDKVTFLTVNKEYTAKGFDKQLGTSWITYSDPETKLPLKLWYEDVHSFHLKYQYVQKQGIKSISMWALGLEDEKIWKYVK